MEQNRNAESHRDPSAPPLPPAEILPLATDHMPEIVEPLRPPDPETAMTQTRRLRHDGWTPDKVRRFLARFGECGVVLEACLEVGMSARAAYNLRDRDPLVAAGWEAACVLSRPKLADEAYSRATNGVVERIYKNGVVVAERHRYDNRLTMSVLARLDQRCDRAEETGAPHLALVARWDEYLAALGEDRREDGLALLAPPEEDAGPAAAPGGDLRTLSGDYELHELHPGEEAVMDEDSHIVWQSEGEWRTDYPPPPGFDGLENGDYGDDDYWRTLSPAEQAVADADVAEERARAEAQRDAWFGFTPGAAPGDEDDANGSDATGDAEQGEDAADP
jgi:hypothetical protein